METPPTGADIVIVGGGMAGLAVAAELAKLSGASILVLEAGPDAGRTHVGQAFGGDDARNLWLFPESDPYFWRPYETDCAHYQGLSGLRRRVGGRSLYWGGAFLPIERWALDHSWPDPIVTDLVDGRNGVPSLYSRVSAEIASWAVGSPVAAPEPLALADAAFWPTAHAVRTVHGKSAIYSPLEKIPTHTKSPAIVPQCQVLGILAAGGRVVGVRARFMNQDIDIAASHVVLAGGTIENSRLAIQILHQSGCLDGHRLPGLADKIAHGFAFSCQAESAHPALRRAAALGTVFHRPLGATLKSNHFVRLWTRRDGAIAFDTWLLGEQERSDGSAVRCVPTGEWPWRTHVTATLSAEDERVRAAQQELLGSFWGDIHELFSMPKSALTFDGDLGSPDLRERLLTAEKGNVGHSPVTYSFPLGSEQHEAGTTPLGTMLDDAHEFRAMPGLSAAGPSAFPRTGAANPAMTILALSLRLAGKLAER